MVLDTPERKLPIPAEKAKAQIIGKDGNAFAVMGRAQAGMRHAGYSKELIAQYMQEAMSGDYDHLLAVTMDYVDDSSDADDDGGYDGIEDEELEQDYWL